MVKTAKRSSLKDAVEEFLTHASIERGLSPRTIEAYGRDLARFAEYLKSARIRSLRARLRAATLSPVACMASAGGPMNLMLQLSQISAKWAFSERNP